MSTTAWPAACSQTRLAAALLDPALPCPPGLRAWNASDPTLRLAVHRNNVVVSLIDALADTFPVVQQLVGEAFFRAMAGVFVRQAPPRSPLLVQYGQDVPGFIAQFEPAAALPYLADVARLELARVRAHHAADADPVSAEAVGLALSSGDRIAELRLVCHPSVSVLASPHALVSIWAAHQGDGALEQVDLDRAEEALVLRQGLDVVVVRAPEGSVPFVQALQQGCGLGDAAAAAAAAAAGFDLSTCLSALLSHGALRAIHLPPRLSA